MRKLLFSASVLSLTVFALMFGQTAKYPTAIANDSDLRVAGNRIQTNLTASMGSGDTAIVVASGTGFQANMLVAVGSEIISICGVSGNILSVGASTTNCPNVDGRGYDGTVAAAHSAGACSSTSTTGCVSNYIAKWYHNSLKEEVKAMQKWSGGLLADIRAFGATCDGTDQNTAVQAAISAGAKRIFIPNGCTWIAPGGIIPAALTIVGESAASTGSVIKSASNPALVTLQVGAGTVLENINAQSNTVNSPTDCPINYLVNASKATQYVISTCYSSFDSISGENGVDRTGAFFKVAATTGQTGDAANFSNCVGSAGCANTGNSLRADQYSATPGYSAIFATAMPGAGDGTSIIATRNFTVGKNVSHLSMFEEQATGGSIVQINQRGAAYTGIPINIEMADVSGSFVGSFSRFLNGGVVKHQINYDGQTYQPGAVNITATTGTAPLVVASTTPVANLTGQVLAYNAAGTQQTNAHTAYGKCTLGTDCAVTFSGAAAWTSSSSYQCTGTDQTSAAAVKVVNTSSTVATFTGTGTDVISYVCIGK